jgi:hypothetical protein
VFNDRIYIDALVFSAPLFILLIYSVIEIFDEFKFTYFRKSIHKINIKSAIIKELCYCKLKNSTNNADAATTFNCLEHCPILKNISLLEDHRHIEDRNNYPYFTSDDIKDVCKLAIKLKDPNDKLSEHILTNNEELQELLDEYIGDIKSPKKLRQSLIERNPKKVKRFIIDLRRLIIIFLLGEWYPSSKSSSKKMSIFYKNFAYPSDMSQRLAHNICIILNRDVLYNGCHYTEGIFPHLDSKLRNQV